VAIPKGNVGIRQTLESLGEKVSWDPVNGISTASGRFSFKPGSFQVDPETNSSYLDPATFGSIVGAAPAKKFDQSYIDGASSLFANQQTAQKSRFQTLLDAIDARIKSGTRKAESAYESGVTSLAGSKANSLDNLRAQMGARNTSTSGAGTTSVRKLEENVSEQQRLLEQSKADSIASLEEQGALANADVANQAMITDADMQAKIYDIAMKNYATEASQEDSRLTNMAKYLLGLSDISREEENSDEEWERKKELASIQHGYSMEESAASRSSNSGASGAKTLLDLRKWIDNEALDRAKADTRLEGKTIKGIAGDTVTKANNSTIFSLPALIEAHRLDLEKQYGLYQEPEQPQALSDFDQATASWSTRKNRDNPNKASGW